MQGAIAHILEPIALQSATFVGGLHSGIVGNIVMVLTDPDVLDKDQDVDMGNDILSKTKEQTDQAWQYGDLDLREVLEESLHKLHESTKSSRYVQP